MKALVKNQNSTAVEDVHVPVIDEENNILIKVQLSGICRTDINVSKGIMPSAPTLILGHEFCGEIAELGPTAGKFKLGDKVTIDPSKFGKKRNLMCGVEVDGAFAEYIKAPEHSVYRLPAALSPLFSAYIEPVAASLAVLNADLKRDQRGCIYGNNRIAKLTHKIMALKGYDNVVIHPACEEVEPERYDYFIETVSRTIDITRMIDAVKVGGKIVLKSRQVRPTEIIINTLVRKEITLQAVNYGDYQEAIELVTSGELDLSELTGAIYDLEDFEEAFATSEQDESKKCYFRL